ncbi:stage II sporulation protein P [Christensenellaceae bacterium NSJ-63]|uniref:Stage II sporulation protein P n=1 Tax=Guopingia tenuis TaxID=2763656 RepID=A0A926DHG9_9FIRM|nr:stage II sporulation protein P [Guopingia tenuis]MBC8537862.1 stage II sporulation protein P [Guopingia tenuis]
MKNAGNGKCFQICVILMVTVLACIGQSMIDHFQGKGQVQAYNETILKLYPQEDEEEEPSGGQEAMLSLLVPKSGETAGSQDAQPVTADGDITDFLLPGVSEKDAKEDSDTKDNSSTKSPTAEYLKQIATRTYEISGETNILIYHTHATEAYRPDGEDTYKATGTSRTDNTDQNIIRVGEELKTQLEKYGFTVIHDTTNHEPPKLSTAYSRSVKTMEAYKEKYPDIDIFIDVHRDAANVETQQDDVVTIDGKRCARLMFVVGTGEGTNGGYNPRPNWEANYTLAKSITEQLDSINEKFTRDIRVKPGRYNQHITDMCLLVEVGHNANTLQEALNSMPHLAKSISQVVKKV